MMFRLIKMKKDTQKLSEILMKMAQTALINPDKDPSSEATSAALLFASTAWNVAVGQKMDIALCKAAIRQFEECNPAFWDEIILPPRIFKVPHTCSKSKPNNDKTIRTSENLR